MTKTIEFYIGTFVSFFFSFLALVSLPRWRYVSSHNLALQLFGICQLYKHPNANAVSLAASHVAEVIIRHFGTF